MLAVVVVLDKAQVELLCLLVLVVLVVVALVVTQ